MTTHDSKPTAIEVIGDGPCVLTAELERADKKHLGSISGSVIDKVSSSPTGD